MLSPTSLSEQLLLSRALAGEQAAWQELHDTYAPVIRGAVASVLRRYRGGYDEADLADCVGEVWLALLRDDCHKLRRYDAHRCRLRGWLRLLATNCAIDQLRGTWGGTSLVESSWALEWVIDERQVQADVQVERRQESEIVQRALSQLKERERTFLYQAVAGRQDTRELARTFGISVNTVHSRKFKIREKLIRLVRRFERPLPPRLAA
jgi:RNA polymerase sigma factor (sigma-70 family)